MYKSTKLLSGFSTCFRQWKAKSHCNNLHGYAIEFKITYACNELDSNHWCMDFGGLTELKLKLAYLFDHTICWAEDDPALPLFRSLNGALQEAKGQMLGVNTIFPAVGCEAFAKEVFQLAQKMCANEHGDRVWVESVECIENKTNSAIYYGEEQVQESYSADESIGFAFDNRHLIETNNRDL